MLKDKQSLALTGLMAGGIFVFGILDILDNFVVLTVLTIVFFTVVINMFYSKFTTEDSTKKQNNSK